MDILITVSWMSRPFHPRLPRPNPCKRWNCLTSTSSANMLCNQELAVPFAKPLHVVMDGKELNPRFQSRLPSVHLWISGFHV